jgi:hypothetical protein
LRLNQIYLFCERFQLPRLVNLTLASGMVYIHMRYSFKKDEGEGMWLMDFIYLYEIEQ